jgi:gamma-glutamyltranspeptidase/glutathione hydrolase
MVQHGFETDRRSFRPVIRGTRLVVSCGHYLGSMAGMQMLARGGNAFDAGVAAVFAQMVLEFQSAGFGGECPMLLYSAQDRRVDAINGNTRAPAAATIEHYRSLGFELVPGDGFLSAGVCATPSSLLTVLERYGSLSLADVTAPAIELAANGFPMYDSFQRAIAGSAQHLREEWPSSAALLLDNDKVPAIGQTYRNPDLAATFEKLVEAEHNAHHLGRQSAIRAAHDRFYQGDIAQAIVDFQRETRTTHPGGPLASGLLTREDFADFQTRVERPASTTYRGYTVYKCGVWSQGPVMLQQLNLLEGFDLSAMGPGTVDYIHTVTEVAKLAFADREQYYADPDFVAVPLDGLLSKAYAQKRRGLIDARRASLAMRPGDPLRNEAEIAEGELVPAGAWQSGTTGTRVVDAMGNLFSATPSGGWLRSSPVVPGLGFALGSRIQMFWLDAQHPAGLAPRKQPRTTLSPSLATRDGSPYLAFGTPGGDQQDQWALQFFLNHVDFGMDIQDATDEPTFHSVHFPSSFYPRASTAGGLVVEASVSEEVRSALADRGHLVRTVDALTQGNVTAVRIDPETGCLEGSSTSRGQKAYAIGW